MKKLFLMALSVLLCATSAFSQMKQVSGKVTSHEDGLPVIGATVVLKGTNKVAVTDVDGHYRFENLPDGTFRLEVSCIGFVTQNVPVDHEVINVVLQVDRIVLDEVVVTGYGNVSKAAYTGSASVLNTDNLKGLPVVNVSQMLEANVPGLTLSSSSGQPGSTTSFRVRGMGSINASNAPLFVLDGVPMMNFNLSEDTNSAGGLGAISTINPADIESVTVLKDAASTSLYGARGSNGVVLITTKKGKEGKTRYSFKASYGVADLAMQFRPIMGGQERRELQLEGMVNKRLEKGDTMAEAMDYANANIDRYAPIPAQGYSDWIGAMFHKGNQQDYSISATGGNKNNQFAASIGYTNQEGISLSSGFERYTIRLNYTNRYKGFEFNVSNLSSLTSNKMTPEGSYYASAMYSSRISLNPSIPIYNEDGSYNTGFSTNGGYNPLNEDANSDYSTKVVRANTSITLAYNFTPWLKLSTLLNADYNHTKEFRYWSPLANDGRESNGQATMRMFENFRVNSISMLAFNKRFNRHNVSAVVAYEIQDTRYEGLYGQGKGYGQLVNNTLSNASIPSDVSQPKNRDGLMSVVVRGNYDYADKYYFSGSFRRDGSSRLSYEGRWSNFWALSGSWRLTGEPWMEGAKSWLSDLKLRLSYGVTGNLPGGYYDYFGSYSTSASYNDEPAIYENRIPFPGLTWEKGKQWDLGLDIKLVDRVSIVLDFYKRNTTNLLLDKPLNNVSGFSEMTANVGELQNKGVELEIRSTNIDKKDFTWTTSFNLSANQNRIVRLSDRPSYKDGRYIREEGRSWSTFYLREYAGVDPQTGKAQYYLNKKLPDGTLDRTLTTDAEEAVPTYLQTINPKVYGGMTNTFRYKWFDLSFNLSYSFGGYTYDNYMWSMQNDGYAYNVNYSTELRRRWKEPGDQTDIPKFVMGYGDGGYYNSSRGIHTSNHVRMKNLIFGFNFPDKWMKAIGFVHARLYFSGTNLFTWARYRQYDPEDTGLINMGVPPLKTYSFGIDFSF